MDEDDIQLIRKQYNSNLIKYELPPGVCSIKDISEVVCTMGDHEAALQVEYDDIGMKTIITSTPFGGIFETLSFDEKSFLIILLGFTPYWDYKPTNRIHAVSPGVKTCDKILNLSTINKIQLKTNVIDRSLVSKLREPILFSFILDTPAGYIIVCQPETVYYKKNKQICFEYYNISIGK